MPRPLYLNKTRTHCPQGHAYDDQNTHVRSDGWRQCRACGRQAARARRAAVRAPGKVPPVIIRGPITITDLPRIATYLASLAIVRANGCIDCKTRVNAGGYSQIQLGKKPYLVHRLVMMVRLGRLLDRRTQVCHKCDNPRCMNVEHLFVGTNTDNSWDMSRKGRAPRASLAPEQVVAAFRALQTGERIVDIAVRFGTTPDVIGNLKAGRSYRPVLVAAGLA